MTSKEDAYLYTRATPWRNVSRRKRKFIAPGARTTGTSVLGLDRLGNKIQGLTDIIRTEAPWRGDYRRIPQRPVKPKFQMENVDILKRIEYLRNIVLELEAENKDIGFSLQGRSIEELEHDFARVEVEEMTKEEKEKFMKPGIQEEERPEEETAAQIQRVEAELIELKREEEEEREKLKTKKKKKKKREEEEEEKEVEIEEGEQEKLEEEEEKEVEIEEEEVGFLTKQKQKAERQKRAAEIARKRRAKEEEEERSKKEMLAFLKRQQREEREKKEEERLQLRGVTEKVRGIPWKRTGALDIPPGREKKKVRFTGVKLPAESPSVIREEIKQEIKKKFPKKLALRVYTFEDHKYRGADMEVLQKMSFKILDIYMTNLTTAEGAQLVFVYFKSSGPMFSFRNEGELFKLIKNQKLKHMIFIRITDNVSLLEGEEQGDRVRTVENIDLRSAFKKANRGGHPYRKDTFNMYTFFRRNPNENKKTVRLIRKQIVWVRGKIRSDEGQRKRKAQGKKAMPGVSRRPKIFFRSRMLPKKERRKDPTKLPVAVFFDKGSNEDGNKIISLVYDYLFSKNGKLTPIVEVLPGNQASIENPDIHVAVYIFAAIKDLKFTYRSRKDIAETLRLSKKVLQEPSFKHVIFVMALDMNQTLETPKKGESVLRSSLRLDDPKKETFERYIFLFPNLKESKWVADRNNVMAEDLYNKLMGINTKTFEL